MKSTRSGIRFLQSVAVVEKLNSLGVFVLSELDFERFLTFQHLTPLPVGAARFRRYSQEAGIDWGRAQ